MTNPQNGLFSLGTTTHLFLEFSLIQKHNSLQAVKALANFEVPQQTFNGLNIVIGFRPSIIYEMAPTEIPNEVFNFDKPRIGPDGFQMPSTQHDIWIWISGPR